MTDLRDWLQDGGRERERDLPPDSEPEESEIIFTMLDIYRDMRAEAHDPGLFVSEAELERRARERLRGRR